MQSGNCGASGCCAANDTDTIFAPLEMLKPVLLTWVKKVNFLAVNRIDCCRFISLIAITEWECQPKVFLLTLTSQRQRNDMFNLKARHDQMLWTQTISTTILSSQTHSLLYFSGDMEPAHFIPVEVILGRDEPRFSTLRLCVPGRAGKPP